GDAGLQEGLILRRERRLLRQARLAGVPTAVADAAPLALPVGEFRVVERLRAGDRETEREQRERTDRAARTHGGPPFGRPPTLRRRGRPGNRLRRVTAAGRLR